VYARLIGHREMKRAPRAQKRDERDATTLMQARMIEAKRKAIERLMLARKISGKARN
jgi:hypothetical protein